MPRSAQLTRVLISRGTERMNILVDADPRLKPFISITLDGDDGGYWQVMKVFETIDRTDIKYGWNNNI